MAVPLLVELVCYHSQGWHEFAFGLFVTGSLGTLLALANHSPHQIELKVREAFLLTTFIWIATSLFAALPIYWSSVNLGFINSWFEAVSALTTTGATIMDDLDHAPKGILLWRSILQWLGGTGIVLMALTILPILRIGGMQLFRSEFSDRSEKILPRVSQISAAIVSIYTFLTIACGLCLWMAGMDIFDACCHAMTTLSTGGLSTHNASIKFFDNATIETIIIIFMIFGSITFILYIRAWQGQWQALYTDLQVRILLKIIFGTGIVIGIWNYQTTPADFIPSLRDSFFTVTSIITSTGYTTIDYTKWAAFPIMLLFTLSCIGGCTGSTAGGIKIFRLQVLSALALSHLYQLRRPHGVFVPLFQGQKIPETVAASVFTFLTVYLLSIFLLTTLLTTFDVSLLDSLSATIAAINNTGPGVTDMIGPSGNYASMAKGAKLTLMLGMIMGRLELLTLFVLFMPSFWKS